MKTVKRIVAVLLAVMLMAPAAVNAAAPSVRDTNLNKKKATATVTYNKKTQLPTTITVNGQKLVVGKDCVIVKKKKSGKKNAGTYKITIKGIGNYSGTTTVTYKIKKAEQKIKTSAKAKTYKASTIKKKGKKFNLKTKAISKKVTYKVTGKKSAKKYIKVSKKGKVTIKKGIKKGTYKIVIKAKATKNHKQGKKVVKITIK
jgi:predicted secreted Zn-dependent protease